ncbi:hypothetical protein E5676_scaffold92G00040 [Cucumis melo var. makuwa]|uniref:Uncharacterized protein n=1 Tax=Cucumis melo var. makuwa TaxID=1194695 RepID=A0A5D3BD33_CUCMM|nr:hypothetical protein E5676_scaffold92G00040 [Cucumis melo var. makuwa]
MCASFGSTRLICASFGSTRLICKGTARGRPTRGRKDADLSLVRKVGSLHAVSERVGHATMDDRRRSVDDAITRRATTLRGWVHSCGAARLAMTADGKLGGTAGLHSRRRGRKGPRLASAWLRRTTGCSRRRRGD